MAQTIHRIFVDPPIAIARLGGSSTPQDAYGWETPANPRSESNTIVAPWWTLDVQADGSIEPRMPTSVTLRDGNLIRPVAPFFEIWASVGEIGSPPSRWRDRPVTPALLRKFNLAESSLSFQFDAQNHKAARRMVDSNLIFGTFPPVTVNGNDHDVHALLATSPVGAVIPMIPAGKSIPLGGIQIMRSRQQPNSTGSGAAWENFVNVEVIRFRFTPARGQFYGPPEAATKTNGHKIAVEKKNAFLDAKAGWYGKATHQTIAPADTYDTRIPETQRHPYQPSLGVVDDTCETRVTITLAWPGHDRAPLKAHANIFVGPPDFAPDRRPFLSLADEIEDRGSAASKRNKAMSKDDREKWVQDLFERIYETVSLFNLDFYQNDRSIKLTGKRLRDEPIPEDKLRLPQHHAMTNMDALRNEDYPVPASSDGQTLPLSEHGRMRHKSIQDIDGLKEFIDKHRGRLKKLIREPFQVEKDETDGTTTMRMPPFMRHSNANPLTLSTWQYRLLMAWVKSVPAGKKPKLSRDAQRRLDQIRAKLEREEEYKK